MVLGLLYTFVLVPRVCSELEYKFTVTRDRNKQYHMYQYTHGYTGTTQEGDGLKVRQNCKQFQSYKQTSQHSCRQTTEASCFETTEQSCGQSTEESCGQTTDQSCGQTSDRQSCGQSRNNMFSVATYNIWNLNNLQGEVYEDRLERLGKVSGYPIHNVTYSCFHSLIHSFITRLFLSSLCFLNVGGSCK